MEGIRLVSLRSKGEAQTWKVKAFGKLIALRGSV